MPAVPITVAGHAVAEPELRYTATGVPVASFRVASSERRRDPATGEWSDGPTVFLTCTAWRAMAENVAETITKGTRVIVTGKLTQRSYETRDGEKRTVYEVEAEDVAASLRNATAKVNRTERSRSSDGQAAPPPAEDPWASEQAPAEPPF